MQLVLLVVHMMIAAALVGVVLLQKSEGGALGIGGGGGGGFLTGRGTANLLTRTTAFLAAAFFITSLSLTLLAQHTQPTGSVLDKAAPVSTTAPSGSPPAVSDTKSLDAKPSDGKSADPAADAKPSDGKPAGRGGILDKLEPKPSPLPR